jgi:prepilin peptidase CpaA
MDLHTFAWNWALAAIVLSVGIGLFAAGWVGGGDVKLAAAASLWLGWEHTMQFLLLASFMGGMLTLLLVVLRNRMVPLILLKTSWTARLLKNGGGVPYGIALGPAAVFVYPETPWMQYVFHAV